MSEKRKNVEKVFEMIKTLSVDDVKDFVTADAVVTTPLGIDMTIPEYVRYLEKLLPEFEITNIKIEEVSDTLFDVRFNMSVVDNKIMHRSEFIGLAKIEFEGNLASKIGIKYDGSAFDIGYLIKRSKEIFPDFEL